MFSAKHVWKETPDTPRQHLPITRQLVASPMMIFVGRIELALDMVVQGSQHAYAGM
jgi:hypothetical protein